MDEESAETCFIDVDSGDGVESLVHEVKISRHLGEDCAGLKGGFVYEIYVLANLLNDSNCGPINLQTKISACEELPSS